jgi:hypothetical protein
VTRRQPTLVMVEARDYVMRIALDYTLGISIRIVEEINKNLKNSFALIRIVK